MLANIIRREVAERKNSVTFLPIPVCEGRVCGGVEAVRPWVEDVACALCEESWVLLVEKACVVASHGVAMVAMWLQ